MTTYEVGQTLTFGLSVYDAAGDLANLGAIGDATITRPDGTTTTVTPTGGGASTGLYSAAHVSAQAGRYRCTFTGSGANSGALPWTDVADVWPADPRLIISLADAKAELNHLTNINDDELRLYVAATTPVIEEIVGRVLSATLTETFDGGKTAVLLSERASAITSVTVGGVATTNYVANLDAGIVYAGTTSGPTSFTWGRQNVVVTYTTGASSIDPNIVLAARVVASHLYQVGQQKRGRNQNEDLTILSSGFAVPSRAVELCRGNRSRKMPGFA